MTPMLIAVRGYAVPADRKKLEKRTPNKKGLPFPAKESLVFDCETLADDSQSLRFGTYQCRNGKGGVESGVFYEPNNRRALSERDIRVLKDYACKKGWRVLTRDDFVQLFYRYAYAYGALVIGFNLPFDLSRIASAISKSKARDVREGFSLQLSPQKNQPNLQARHLNARASFIRFARSGQMDGRSARKQGHKTAFRTGYFQDVKTLAAALLGQGQSLTLKKLADLLQTEHRKLDAGKHGGPLTESYLEYAMTDTQVTWECYEKLAAAYKDHGLKETPAHRIYSEASLGKAYLNQMGIVPPSKLPFQVPPQITGWTLGTYYGGRSEVRIRRQIVRVLYCDFRSMYPTVCTLMGLWSFVTAKNFTWIDCTEVTVRTLQRTNLASLQQKELWRHLTTLVEIIPNEDALPIRAAYDNGSRTIGLNYLSAAFSMWFTMADCIASKLLSGKMPKVVRAIKFAPGPMQTGLRGVNLAGDEKFRIDPANGDFYRDLILRRGQVQTLLKSENDPVTRQLLGAQQMMLKLIANSTSYGIFAEQNVHSHDRPRPLRLFGMEPEFSSASKSIEEPGSHFHPLIATLITGAARLMLACAEKLAVDQGLDWAFCDTDSLAMARPQWMGDPEFLRRAQLVTAWFSELDPYSDGKPLFKLEDENFRLEDGKVTGEHQELFALAISAKRYVLFNVDGLGLPVPRKVLAHGLGHLMEPYPESEAPDFIPPPRCELEVKRWQYDLWYLIIRAFQEGHPDRIDLSRIPQLNQPVRSRYSATTPQLLSWFRKFNKGKPFSQQVKCFNFMVALAVSKPGFNQAVASGQIDSEEFESELPAMIAPYSDDPEEVVRSCFDRRTGKRVPRSILKTYREAIAEYAFHSESKFDNGSGFDCGRTERRHIEAIGAENIGKEANRWEEQMHVGELPEVHVEYGMSKEGRSRVIEFLRRVVSRRTAIALANGAGITRQELAAILEGRSVPRARTLRKLVASAQSLISSPASGQQ